MEKFDARNLVDRLGEVRAEMKVLADEAKNIEAVLKASGDDRFDGDYFTVTVSRYERATVAWKKIAEKLNASKYMKETYSKISDVCTLKVTAHTKA